MKLIIASNNSGKIREFKQLLEPLGYEVLSQSEAGICIDVEETGNTFEENARLKAEAVYKLSGFSVIADDSGLEVDYLGGEPGIYSARYAPEGGRKKKILEKLEGVPVAQRAARFVCCICYIDGENPIPETVTGVCGGYIGFEERGDNGFGYDPIFMIGDKSFAELSDFEKNAVSHRGAALRKLAEMLGAV
ncbi:MAG: RdgB/HAM1 family non-canonical purine NTP pyrophosphatase [Oscillospiraceae bacterium]|nr:RdgB/HAM1 family non-canonical purine NTP pyrophosphatase [Oscillospiraceae bacterium]